MKDDIILGYQPQRSKVQITGITEGVHREITRNSRKDSGHMLQTKEAQQVP